jgi:uncharacterized protein (TIGR02268 family)
MISSLLALLLTASPSGSSGARSPPEVPCENRRRFELSLPATLPHEVCIGPGVITSFLFDTPAVVELQDEARFQQVMRGQTAVSFMPPRDMTPGERLRLTAELRTGGIPQTVAFTLVMHPDQATHQVDVYRDRRDWQTLYEQVNQAWLETNRLDKENTSLRLALSEAQGGLELLSGLRAAYVLGLLENTGVVCADATSATPSSPTRELKGLGMKSCRGPSSVAIILKLDNIGSAPWTLAEALLVDSQGKRKKSVRVLQKAAIEPGGMARVFVEFEASADEAQGFHTLTLQGMGTAVVTLSQVTFP